MRHALDPVRAPFEPATHPVSLLDAGDAFPELELKTLHHGSLALPHAITTRWALVLFYRAHW